MLDALARHGARPSPDTPPERLHDFVNDLYRYELRRLRTRLLAGEIAKADYSSHVTALKERYPLLSLPARYWTEDA